VADQGEVLRGGKLSPTARSGTGPGAFGRRDRHLAAIDEGAHRARERKRTGRGPGQQSTRLMGVRTQDPYARGGEGERASDQHGSRRPPPTPALCGRATVTAAPDHEQPHHARWSGPEGEATRTGERHRRRGGESGASRRILESARSDHEQAKAFSRLTTAPDQAAGNAVERQGCRLARRPRATAAARVAAAGHRSGAASSRRADAGRRADDPPGLRRVGAGRRRKDRVDDRAQGLKNGGTKLRHALSGSPAGPGMMERRRVSEIRDADARRPARSSAGTPMVGAGAIARARRTAAAATAGPPTGCASSGASGRWAIRC